MEREEFALRMLCDVLIALSGSLVDEVEILSTGGAEELMDDLRSTLSEDLALMGMDIEVMVDMKPLNDALNGVIARCEQPVLIMMADIPLVTPESINAMVERSEDIVVSPGRKGGTNALLIRKPSLFSVSYYGLSCIEHLNRARECNMTSAIHDSFFMSVDIDEADDLVEVLIHGEHTYSARYLNDIGLHLHADKESKTRVEVERWI